MKLTDQIIDSMERAELIEALNDALNTMHQVEAYRNSISVANQKIEQIKAQAESIRTGGGSGLAILGSVGGFILGIAVGGFILGVIIAVIAPIIISSVRKRKVGPEKEVQAQEYLEQNLPAAISERDKLQSAYNNYLSSIDVYNLKLLVPNDYCNPDALTGIIGMLQNRRARTLSEAINAYETMLHQQRIESYNYEQLTAAKEAVAAQQRAADAAEDAARSSRDIAQTNRDISNSNRDIASSSRDIAANSRAQVAANRASAKGTVECIYCRERVSARASICPHCGNTLPDELGRLIDRITQF